VRIALVADIEQQPVVAEVEHVVKRNRQLDDAQVRREVTAGLHDLSTDRLADLGREPGKLADRQCLDIPGILDGGKNLHLHAS